MKQHYVLVLAALLPLSTIATNALAQDAKNQLPDQQKVHVHYIPEGDSVEVLSETLSGIHLLPGKKGNFQLDFKQELKEDARLEIKNKAGKMIYHTPVSIKKNRQAWKFNVGKLRPDIYTVEVKTSDTTYWTKFKVSK